MNTSTRTSRSPLIFFILVFVISVPFWLIGALAEQFLPKDLPFNLPVSSLMAFNPMIAALILVFRESGTEGVKSLLKRCFDYRRIQSKIWYLPIFLLMPLIMILSYGLMKLTGNSIPDPQLPILMIPVFFIVFFVSAVGEEIGWSGYAIDPLQERWGALQASIILGVIWAAWHVVPDIQAHHVPTWIVWQCLSTVGLRVLIVWFYNNTGKSLFAAIAFHAMINVSDFLFPNYGSYYDPFTACIFIGMAAATVAMVWGPNSTTSHRVSHTDPL